MNKNLTALDTQKKSDYERLQASRGLSRVSLFRKLQKKYGVNWELSFKPKQKITVAGKLK
jgi:hypothetical protein